MQVFPVVGVLQCVAVRCSAMQCVLVIAVRYRAFAGVPCSECVSMCCSVLQRVAACCSMLQCVLVIVVRFWRLQVFPALSVGEQIGASERENEQTRKQKRERARERTRQ